MKLCLTIIYVLLLSPMVWAVSENDYAYEIKEGSLFEVKSEFVLSKNTNFFYFESKEFGKICSLFYPKYAEDQTIEPGYKLRVFGVGHSTGSHPTLGYILKSETNGWMPQLHCEPRANDGQYYVEPLTIAELRRIFEDYFEMQLVEE